MLRRANPVVSASRRLFSTSPATTVLDRLMAADWVDNDEPSATIIAADATVDAYRAKYDPEVAASGSGKDVYDSMATLYAAKETAKLVEDYSTYIEDLMRDHMAMTGFLGNETKIPEGQEEKAVEVLKEYVQFVNSIENDSIRAKVEEQLGRKIILMRMAVSVENFAAEFTPVACDHLVSKTSR